MRRFKDFYNLDKYLCSKYKNKAFKLLVGRELMNTKNTGYNRREPLFDFLFTILSDPELIKDENVIAFIHTTVEFFINNTIDQLQTSSTEFLFRDCAEKNFSGN